MAKMGEASQDFPQPVSDASGAQVGVTQSRVLDWEDLRRQNLIVLGNNESNKWIDPLLNKYPFQFATTAAHEPRSIINTHPLNGESPSIASLTPGTKTRPMKSTLSYRCCQVSNRIVSCFLSTDLNMQATQVATEYLTTEGTLQELLARLRTAAPKHTGPWRFQAVLRPRVYGNVPTRANLVSSSSAE